MTKKLNIIESMRNDVRFKRILREKFEVNRSANFLKIVNDTVVDEINTSLQSLMNELMNGTMIVDNINKNVEAGVNTQIELLQDEIVKPLDRKMTDEQYKSFMNTARPELENIFNSLSDLLVLPDNVQESFKEVLYDTKISQAKALEQLKFVLNQIMSNYSSGYSAEVIKTKNDLIKTIFKKFNTALKTE